MHHHGCGPDTFERLRFQVTWSGKRLLGVRRVVGLTRVTEVVVHHDGGSTISSKAPGRTEFKAWADKVIELGSRALPPKFRQDVLVELLDESDKVVLACRVRRCWASERSLFPVPDESGGDAIQRFRIENDGWTREK